MKQLLAYVACTVALTCAVGEFDNTVLHGDTDKRAIDYAPGKPIKFKLSL